MKIRKTLLWFIPQVMLLLVNCTTSYTYNHDGYNFENNDVLIDNYGETYACPYVMLGGDTKIRFKLYTGSQIKKEKRYYGGVYRLSLGVESKYPLKSIKTVTLNRVTIQVGENEFNMIEIINEITTVFKGKDKKIIYTRFSEEDIGTVHSTGIIDIEAHKENFDDLLDGTIASDTSISFYIIPIDYTIYKEIIMKFDIIVEYTTGETVRLDQEFLGIYEVKRIKIYRPFFTV